MLSEEERKRRKREQNKRWAQQNPDKVKQYRQAYYRKHKERLNHQSNEYRKAHLAEINEYHKRRRAEGIEKYNPEYMSKYMRKYRASDVGNYSNQEFIRQINYRYNVSVSTVGEALAVQYYNRSMRLEAQIKKLKDKIEYEKTIKIKYKIKYKEIKEKYTDLESKYKTLYRRDK